MIEILYYVLMSIPLVIYAIVALIYFIGGLGHLMSLKNEENK